MSIVGRTDGQTYGRTSGHPSDNITITFVGKVPKKGTCLHDDYSYESEW